MMSGWGFDWVFMVTLWALFVVGLVWLVASFSRGGDGGARRILDERFAAGELTSEEYEQRRRALRRVPWSAVPAHRAPLCSGR